METKENGSMLSVYENRNQTELFVPGKLQHCCYDYTTGKPRFARLIEKGKLKYLDLRKLFTLTYPLVLQ